MNNGNRQYIAIILISVLSFIYSPFALTHAVPGLKNLIDSLHIYMLVEMKRLNLISPCPHVSGVAIPPGPLQVQLIGRRAERRRRGREAELRADLGWVDGCWSYH